MKDKQVNSIEYNYKIDQLYKFVSQGWSVSVSESKADLKYKTKSYDLYKDSEHFQRVRNIAKGTKHVI